MRFLALALSTWIMVLDKFEKQLFVKFSPSITRLCNRVLLGEEIQYHMKIHLRMIITLSASEHDT
jgi:hypothetical protein